MATSSQGAGGRAAGTRPLAWARSVGYQVYIRSFADADGDGIGDLRGLLGRLDHLAALGVDVVWVTPFFPSPMADFGYDVADYRDVDPVFGTLADAEAVLARARELGLRVVLDLVANHTSTQHAWFRDALRGRDAEHRDWYVWADPAPDGGPPNNWQSYFGGPAWSFDEASGQWYLHLFLPEQADLNWANPAVADAFDDILRFWLERGAGGFRIDVAQGFAKDPALRSNPSLAPHLPGMTPYEAWQTYDHRHDIDQAGNVEIFRRFRRVADEHDALLVGEVYLTDPARLVRYVGGDGLHLTHYFAPMKLGWDAEALRAALVAAADALGDHVGWVQSSHDDPRAVTRFGGGERGRARALALATVFAGLPGMPFLYQGEELGLEQVEIPPALLADPVAVRAGDVVGGRDGQRAPIPWGAGPGRGFTTGTPWLPFGNDGPGLSVDEQERDAASMLAAYRRLIAARRALPDLDGVAPAWLAAPEGVVGYRRGPLLVALNAGEAPCPLPGAAGAEVLFATGPEAAAVASGAHLPADGAVMLRSRDDS